MGIKPGGERLKIKPNCEQTLGWGHAGGSISIIDEVPEKVHKFWLDKDMRQSLCMFGYCDNHYYRAEYKDDADDNYAAADNYDNNAGF